MSRPQDLNFTVNSGDLNAELDFLANSVVVDNATNQYLHLLSIDKYVPPGTFRATYSLKTSRIAQARFEAPPGIVAAPVIAGQAAGLSFYSESLPPTTGTMTIQTVQPANLLAKLTAAVGATVSALANPLLTGSKTFGILTTAVPGANCRVLGTQTGVTYFASPVFGQMENPLIQVGDTALDFYLNNTGGAGAVTAYLAAFTDPVAVFALPGDFLRFTSLRPPGIRAGFNVTPAAAAVVNLIPATAGVRVVLYEVIANNLSTATQDLSALESTDASPLHNLSNQMTVPQPVVFGGLVLAVGLGLQLRNSGGGPRQWIGSLSYNVV